MTSTKIYDAFLSHNSQDKPAVEQIARWLEDKAGLKVWLDKWNLIPGDPWQEGIEDALDQSRCCVVFLGPNGLGPWQNEEMRAALDERVAQGTIRVVPVLLPGRDRSQIKKDIPRFLRRLTWVDFQNTVDDEDALQKLVCGITGTPPGRTSYGKISRPGVFTRLKARLRRQPGWFATLILIPILIFLFQKAFEKLTETKTGSLLIKCNVDSAQVYVNSQFSGWTRADTVVEVGEFNPGRYTVDIFKHNLDSLLNQSVDVKKGEACTLPVTLQKKTPAIKKPRSEPVKKPLPKHKLTIYLPVKFQQAKIYVDGKWIANGNCTPRLTAGQHLIRIETESLFYEEKLTVPDRHLLNVSEKDFKPLKP